jgi:hypothetical protein
MTKITMIPPEEDNYLFKVEYNGTKLGLTIDSSSSSSSSSRSSNEHQGGSVFVKDNILSVSDKVEIGDIVMSINNINVQKQTHHREVMKMIQNALAGSGAGDEERGREGITPKCIITFKRPIITITLREQCEDVRRKIRC